MVANVLVELTNRNIDKTFTYNVPAFMEGDIKVGIRVEVPFGKQKLEGFVLSIEEESSFQTDLKDIISLIDSNVILNDELLSLGCFIKESTLCTLISAYQAMLPKAFKAKKNVSINKKFDKFISLNVPVDNFSNYKFNDRQKDLIEKLIIAKVKKEELIKEFGGTVKGLLDKKVIKEELVEKYRYNIDKSISYPRYELNLEQRKAFDNILASDKPNLLFGVTGSGKTEVYMEIIEHMLLFGKTAIVLVPEISLTPQMVGRFISRFGSRIAILHSRLSDGEKYDEYRRILKEEVNIVIGARSAIFAPLKNIGAIIIDEEHTNTYKQESTPKYNAIDIAIERAKYHSAKVILGSATPSMESYAKVIANRYNLVELKTRANNKKLPEILIVDMNKEMKKGGYFSQPLINAINEKLSLNEQIILLLNRRGYASFVTCSNCGFVSKCPNCDITLTYHKSSDMERCHYCGYAIKRHSLCPECHEDAIKNLGIGTERVEEELNKLFKARVIRMDFDTTGTKGAHEKIIAAFKNHEYDILLGTQMIAKGLDFSNVTLVGVINADTSLMIPNFRSSEYTFQLLSQVAGRSGRGDKVGNVIIQTFNKEHYAIEFASKHKYMDFFKKEMSIRRELNYPPYSYLVSIKVISKEYDLVSRESNIIASRLRENLSSSIVLGPSIGSTFKVNNTYKFGILIKYKKEDNLYPYLEKLLNYYKNNSKIKLDIDFNPISC